MRITVDTISALQVVADAATFTAGALADEAYDRRTLGSEQGAILAISKGWSLFADSLGTMISNLQGELIESAP